MTGPWAVVLNDRGVLAVTGDDRVPFLQGLISNDIRRVSAERAVYAALLTAQGKYLHDFFVHAEGDALLLDGEAARLADLSRRLTVYRLRSRVRLEDRSARFAVLALFGPGADEGAGLANAGAGAAVPFAGGIACIDPRLAAAGVRALVPADGIDAALAQARATAVDRVAYDRHRIGLGLPDGSRDMVIEKSLLLECGIDALNGIDWEKGCYLGQELTARTRYRGLIRKRLVPVLVEGALPPPGSPILSAGSDVGEIRSGVDGLALALLRREVLTEGGNAPLLCATARLIPKPPAWFRA